MDTMYILCICPSVNFESSSETRGQEGMLSIRTVLHFHLVDLRYQFQDIPVRAAFGLLIFVGLSAVPLVSAGSRRGREQDVSERCQRRAGLARTFHRQGEWSRGHRRGKVSPDEYGGLCERRLASFAKEQCESDRAGSETRGTASAFGGCASAEHQAKPCDEHPSDRAVDWEIVPITLPKWIHAKETVLGANINGPLMVLSGQLALR